ncbi:hypothetical protein DFH94DRAFT_783415 [Russula ochroleuca]|jgi:hypothetical protein|uniref:Uncharacterized protein n=1 Tax=Russula ochroleuca TaxID=152965 RepID=A0A9P5JWD6_9AGAM|nr:hypothetical protein DFH94DRAFT_783415 [Russula ochroleuca]
MKQPLFKRRRVLSNPHTPSPSSEAFVTSLKALKISTCMSCHRTVGLKSSPAFLCGRCNASTCAICLRTCTGDPVSSPHWPGSLNLVLDSTTIPPFQSNANTSRRRRSRGEDSDDILKTKDVDNERSGCGQTVCRKCCFEHPQSGSIACLDCSEKQLALQTHESMHGARKPDHCLIAST